MIIELAPVADVSKAWTAVECAEWHTQRAVELQAEVRMLIQNKNPDEAERVLQIADIHTRTSVLLLELVRGRLH